MGVEGDFVEEELIEVVDYVDVDHVLVFPILVLEVVGDLSDIGGTLEDSLY